MDIILILDRSQLFRGLLRVLYVDLFYTVNFHRKKEFPWLIIITIFFENNHRIERGEQFNQLSFMI